MDVEINFSKLHLQLHQRESPCFGTVIPTPASISALIRGGKIRPRSVEFTGRTGHSVAKTVTVYL
jgi:hypothetical protein